MRKDFVFRIWQSLRRGLAIAAAAAITRTASAQVPDTSSVAARAVGLAYLNAISAEDWKAAAGFLDLVPLDHYRLSQIDFARRIRQPPAITAEQLMKHDSTMTRAVAEWQVQRMKDHSHQQSILEYQFGVADPDSLAAMPLEVVAQRWLERHDPRWGVRAALRASNCQTSVADSLVPVPKFTVLGIVAKEGTAYLLYERDDDPNVLIDDIRSRGPSMVVLHHRIDTWWVIPRVEMNGISGLAMACSSTIPRRK
jgi:hypothetical protein